MLENVNVRGIGGQKKTKTCQRSLWSTSKCTKKSSKLPLCPVLTALFGCTRASSCAMLLFEPFFFVVCLMFCRMLIVECWRKLSVRFRQATFFIRSKLQLFPTRLILVGKAFFSERAKVRNYFVYMIMIHNFKRYCLLSDARIKILHTDRLDF